MIRSKERTITSPQGKEFHQQEPEWLDNSGYSSYSRCPAKYFFSSVLGLRGGGKFIALEYGTATHEAMPYLQRDDLQGALDAFERYWDPLIEDGTIEENAVRTKTNAFKMLSHWHEEKILSGANPYEIIEPPEGALETEDGYSDQEFAFCVDISTGTTCGKCDGAGMFVDLLSLAQDPSKNTPQKCPTCNGLGVLEALPFAGRVDGLGRLKQNGKIWLVEYKTAGQFGQTFLTSFDLNSQPYGYAVALKVLYPDMDIQGCFIEALRVSKTNPACLTIPIFYEEPVIEAFIESFNLVSSRIKESYRSGEWDQNFSACAPYAQHGISGYQCPYAALCKSDDWTEYLDMWTVNRWKPFKELSGDGSEDG